MRRRQGRIGAGLEAGKSLASSCVEDASRQPDGPEEGQVTGQVDSGIDTRERVYSWLDIVRAGAQLTLDVMRVMREAADLYRKLSGGRGGTG